MYNSILNKIKFTYSEDEILCDLYIVYVYDGIAEHIHCDSYFKTAIDKAGRKEILRRLFIVLNYYGCTFDISYAATSELIILKVENVSKSLYSLLRINGWSTKHLVELYNVTPRNRLNAKI